MTMSLLTGPGRNSEMSVMRSSNVSGPNLPTSSRWPGDSIWNMPRVRVDRISANVSGSSSGTWRPRRRGRPSACRRPDAISVERVGHRRLHADAEHVELEQTELLDVVLVELAHREAEPARLDRGAVEQGGVGEEYAARVQRDVPGQPVEPLDHAEQQVELGFGQMGGAQLGQLGAARGGHRARGCAGTPWRWRRSRRAACRARHRRRGSRGERGRCPSSTRTRPARRRSGRGSARRPRCGGPTRRRCRRRAARCAAGRGSAP